MELTAKARHLPFMTANARLADRFHITLGDDTFIERAYWIWRSIGNIATDTKTATVNIGTDLIVTLPQDCEFVESLSTTAFQDGRNFDGSYGDYYFNAKGRQPEVRPDPGATSVEANVKASITTIPGERVNYKTYDGYLKVTSPLMAGQMATLVYKSIVAGEDGLPLLNDVEAEAIAVTLALREAESQLFRKEPGANILVQYLAAESTKLLSAAQNSDEKISDDGLDKLLDIKTSWGRKVFGNRFIFR
jgi:hypothetical protein